MTLQNDFTKFVRGYLILTLDLLKKKKKTRYKCYKKILIVLSIDLCHFNSSQNK